MSETKESLLEKIAEKVSVNLSELFKKKIELETAKLVNGVTVEYEGEDVFILNDEGEKLPAPEGEHELEDGRILVVKEEGKLDEIKEKEAEEVEAKEEEKKEMQEFASKDEVEQLKKEVEELKSMMKPKEEMAKEEKPKETELKKEEVQLNADDAKRVNHSPEKKVEQKVKQNFSKNFGTTKDRVFARIANK